MSNNINKIQNSNDTGIVTTATRASCKLGSGGQRGALFVASAPLLLMGTACLFSVVQRQIVDRYQTFGHLTRTQAQKIAGEVCTRLTGETVKPTQTSFQSAYSLRRGTTVREWDVVCSTSEAQYLLRLNADTRRVYAVNRLSGDERITDPEDRSADTPSQSAWNDATNIASSQDSAAKTTPLYSQGEAEAAGGGMTPRVSRHEAEQQARRYLRVMGVPVQELRPISAANTTVGSDQWNFTFRRNVPGIGNRLLKVSVDGRDGALEHAWNPVYAL